ncbi:MAG TPA: RecQ family ATP-dependent DNA helicase [Bacteroidetes bacterium]|nr:RecQ family ATP-dependent DNA helicase [Bacteroidota bacterium]
MNTSTIHSEDLLTLLKKYWGFEAFRPVQLDIIESVLAKKDTLALLPTGGGKSICFQLPALFQDGMCLVISPLIALMKDQVHNLVKRKIPAASVHSGMSSREVDLTLEKCMKGEFKFLYLSPERLTTEIFRARLPQMKINLLAVDEAHCISQWGYDFRPPYLQIAEVRAVMPDIPVLALTASATEDVCVDIMEKLSFKSANLIRKSFERKNLSYSVLFEEDKFGRLVKMLDKVGGTAIVYVRNRRKTKELVQFLLQNKVSATEYHAGLSAIDRSKRQEDWIHNRVRVIVCTNAFGMGIDKPDVRLVVHWDSPDNIESYFQEAGRAGRDEKKSFAVLMFSNAEITELKAREGEQFPDLNFVKNVYEKAGTFCRIAEGAGEKESFNFDLNAFIKTYDLKAIPTLQSLRILEQNGYISFSQSVHLPSRIMIVVGKEQLYRFEVIHPEHEQLLKAILRTYGGVFDYFVPIREEDLANALGTTYIEVINHLRFLQSSNLLQYEERNENPQLFFLTPRLKPAALEFDMGLQTRRREKFRHRLDAMLQYMTDHTHCRSEMLLHYFGEHNTNRCGICDVCLRRNKLEVSDVEFENIVSNFKSLLSESILNSNEILSHFRGVNEDKLLHTLRWLIDQNMIIENESHQYKWR